MRGWERWLNESHGAGVAMYVKFSIADMERERGRQWGTGKKGEGEATAVPKATPMSDERDDRTPEDRAELNGCARCAEAARPVLARDVGFDAESPLQVDDRDCVSLTPLRSVVP